MKVLLYSLNYAPELTGIGRYNAEMARWLVRQGHEVRVVAAPPYYPAWSVSAPYRSWSFRKETLDGIDVMRCPLWVPARPSGWRRIVHLVSFAASSVVGLAGSVRWRPDVVLVTEPPLACAPGALAFCALTGSRSWLHVQDLEIDAGFGLGFMKRAWLRRLVCAGERVLLRRFETVTTISTTMRNALAARVGADQDVGLMRNWVDVNAVRPVDASALRRSLGIPRDAIVCLYSGSMAAKQGLDVLGRVVRRLSSREDVHFVFCGEGASREALVRDVGGLARVHFMPLQPAERLAELLSMADVHLLPQRADADGLVMPSKLCGIFASARPVVVTAPAGSELSQVVAGKGLVVQPDDDEAFAAAIVSLADDSVRRHVFGVEARSYAERILDLDAVLSQAFGGFDDVLPEDDDELAPARTTDR